MKYLVTGGLGFIGLHIVEELVLRGNRVKVLDIKAPSSMNNGNVEFFQGNIGDENLLDSILKDIDIVYHIAWTTIPKTSNDNITYDIQSNLINTVKLLDKCVENGVKKIVFTSSGGTVYGNLVTNPIKEDYSTNPISSYGITKLTVEKYLNLYYELYNLNYVVLRCSNPFGERQNYLKNQGLITSLLYKIKINQPFTVWGDGNIVRDYIYIKDLVEAHIKAADYNGNEKIFNIGSGVGRTINEIIKLINNSLNTKVEVKYEKDRKYDVEKNILSIEKAKSELNWYPKIRIEEGIVRTWDWIKETANK